MLHAAPGTSSSPPDLLQSRLSTYMYYWLIASIAQSYALQYGQGPLRFTWKSDAEGRPLSIFERSPATTLPCSKPFDDLQPYYWVVQGIEGAEISPGRSELLLLAVRVVGAPGIGLGFKVLGTTAIVVTNPAAEPQDWRYSTKDVTTCSGDDPATCEQWTTAVAPAPATPDCLACIYIVGQPGPTTAKAQVRARYASVLSKCRLTEFVLLVRSCAAQLARCSIFPSQRRRSCAPTGSGVAAFQGQQRLQWPSAWASSISNQALLWCSTLS